MTINVNGKETIRRCEVEHREKPFTNQRADQPVRIYTPVLYGREELVETMDGLQIIGME